MKKILFLLNTLSLGFVIHAVGVGDGRSIVDEQLFQSIRSYYDSSWQSDVESTARGEILRDGSVLIEVDSQMAGFFFYNLRQAREDILYIPSANKGRYSASWLNYFDRLSDNLACGLSSGDLKEDPFPDFKCRFRIDSAGKLHAFLDRDAQSSAATPPAGDHKWESGQHDFHLRNLNQLVSPTDAYSMHMRDLHEGASFHFQVFGAIAAQIYNKLEVEPKNINWGPFPLKMKVGEQIWCVDMLKGPSDFKCRIGFNFDGQAYQDQDRKN